MVRKFACDIDPLPNHQVQRTDFFDNEYIYFAVQKPHQQLTVSASSEVTVHLPPWVGISPEDSPPWEAVADWLRGTEPSNDTKQFCLESTHARFIPGIRAFAECSFRPSQPIMACLKDLNSRIYEAFAFTPGFTEVSTPLETVFAHKKGVCQDFAHFGLACVRAMGLAARYVSGYIETMPPPGQPRLAGADASHAWIAVFVPHLGWVEFDATNNLLVADQHIRVAYGRDFSDVVPMKGVVYSGGSQKMVVTVDVARQA